MKTVPINHTGPGYKPEPFKKMKKKITKIINDLPTREERIKARSAYNVILNSNPSKSWFELITNIPISAMEVIWDIMIKDGGMIVTYVQDTAGPSLKTLKKNMASTNHSLKDMGNKNKSDSSSIYGTGLTTIGDYCDSLVITSIPADGSKSFSIDLNTNEDLDVNDISPYGFKIEMRMPHSKRMGSYANFIGKLRDMIRDYDAIPISEGRVHKFNISGLSTGTDNVELSKPLQANLLTNHIVDLGGNKTDVPILDGLDDGDKKITEVVIDSVNQDNQDTKITLKNLALYKRTKDFTLPGFSGDKPMLVLYYDETKQLVFTLPLRNGNSETSLNNVVLFARVSKKELALFLTNTDKMDGVSPILKNHLFEQLRPYLLRTFPDTNLVEKMSQLFIYDIIVFDKIGKKFSKQFRNECGLGAMNNMSVDERENIVKMEKSKENSRYDIVIDMIWITEGKVTKHTPRWLAENKRQDFNRNDRNQLFGYTIKDSSVIHAVAISNQITKKCEDAFDNDVNDIDRAGRLDGVTFQIVDVDELGFNEEQYFTHYLKIAQDM
jgi:hypothetical protein